MPLNARVLNGSSTNVFCELITMAITRSNLAVVSWTAPLWSPGALLRKLWSLSAGVRPGWEWQQRFHICNTEQVEFQSNSIKSSKGHEVHQTHTARVKWVVNYSQLNLQWVLGKRVQIQYFTRITRLVNTQYKSRNGTNKNTRDHDRSNYIHIY